MANYGDTDTALADDENTRSLLGAINAEESVAYGGDNDSELSDECAANINRYLGRNVRPAPAGSSNVRDRSVYETVQWMQPSLARIFANGDDVVELPPIGPEDMEPAKQEAQYLNHLILQKNNWFQTFDTASKDALTVKRGYLYVYSEKKKIPELEKYVKQTPESLALLMQDKPEVVSQAAYPDPDYEPQPMVQMTEMGPVPVMGPDGQPVMQPPPMLYDVEIRLTKEQRKFCIEALPPERCKVSAKTKTVQVADACPYFEYYDFPTISELRQDGLEIDDDVAADEDTETPEEFARNQYSELAPDDSNRSDPSMRRVKCRYVWIRHDFDDDGIAELQFCIVVGQSVLHREECSRIPIAVLCPDALPHRHIGTCPADSAGEIEEVKTEILRQGINSLYHSNNPQKFADPRYVNLDDLGVSRVGGIFRVKAGAVFGQNFGVMPMPFVFPQAMEGLEYMDQVKENRVGVNRYFTGIDQNALNKTKGGMEMLSTMSAQRVEQIARHYANGVEVMASLLHEQVLKSGHQKEVVQLRGKWVTVDPASWRKRTDFRISVGFAAGNKDQLVQRLMMIANMQKEAAMGGLPIVTPQNIYETAMEMTKATDMQAPGRFWTEPSKAPQKGPPQPDPSVVFAEQENTKRTLAAKQMDVRQKELDSQRDFAIKKEELQVKAQIDLTKHREALQHERETTTFGARKDEHMARLSADLNPKNIEASAKAQESATASEVLRALQQSNQQQTQIILKAFEELTKAMSAPRVIDRDPKSGKAVGSRIAASAN